MPNTNAISPLLQKEVEALGSVLAARFTPPELYMGCKVLDITDKDLYATNNGWIECLVAHHNQQRCRWRGQIPGIAVDDFVDVMYFASYRLFVVFGQGGTGAVATPATTDDVAASMTVNNGSVSTASANDVGYIDASGDYQTTTTANLEAAWCVVITGGASGADITVAVRGRVTVKYAGTAPSAGDYLVTSTTAGSAGQQTTMRPEIFAVCTANGAGGTVEALLLTQTRFVPKTSTTPLYTCLSHSSTTFTGTINGAPTTTSVVYTLSTGAEDAIKPNAAGLLGLLVLHNTTRGTERLIDSVDTGTNTITTISSTDSWADTDAITIASPTINDGLTPPFSELDFSQQSEIPALARAVVFRAIVKDSNGAGFYNQVHPYESYDVDKISPVIQTTQTTEFNSDAFIAASLINRKFGTRGVTAGTSTAERYYNLIGYFEAIP